MLIFDTAGNEIKQPFFYPCDCGLTGGCKKCRNFFYPTIHRESFIGILTDDEAREMKERISLFKKSFDDDLARRNKILFGI